MLLRWSWHALYVLVNQVLFILLFVSACSLMITLVFAHVYKKLAVKVRQFTITVCNLFFVISMSEFTAGTMNEELLLGSWVIEVLFMEHLSSFSQKDLFMVLGSMLNL